MASVTSSSNYNRKWPQCVVTAITMLYLFSAGIHLGWPSPSIPILLSDEFAFEVTQTEADWVVNVSSIGQIFGYLAASFLMDVIGRKLSILMGPPLYIISAVLTYFCSKSIVLLYISRFVGGMAEGTSVILIPVYISEISEPQIRGSLVGCFMLFMPAGNLFINLVGARYSIETTALIIMAFPIIFFVFFIFLPETPYYFLMKNQDEKARASLRILRWNQFVEEEIIQMRKDVRRQMSERGKFQDLIFQRSNRKAFVVMLGIVFLEVFSGIATLIMYAQTFFAEATDVIPKEWAAASTQIVKIISVLVAVAFIDFAGRRIFLMISMAPGSLIITLISIYFFLKDYTEIAVENYSLLILIGVNLYFVCFGFGVGVAGKCLLGELFSASIKSKAICSLYLLQSLFILASTFLYQYLSIKFTTGAPLLMYGIIQFMGVWYCWFFVPETKKKTLEEIQQDLKM